MKKILIFSILLVTILLAACTTEGINPTVEPTQVPPTPQPATPTTPPTAPTSADAEILLGKTWEWVGFTNPTQKFEVEMPENYTLTFQADGTVSIKADCNNAVGSYALDGSSIKIEIGPMTMAACPSESRSDEFIKVLGFAAIYFFQDGHLFIDLFADGGTLEFAPTGETGMAEPTPSTQAENLPRYEPLEECFTSPPEDVEVAVKYDCGYVVVPEFYHGESTRELKVPFIRFNSGKGSAASPLLIHPGGPGASQLNDSVFPLVAAMFSGVITERDVIFMDPRGTEFSDTFLDCPAIYSLPWKAYEQGLNDEAANALFTETLQKCIDDFRSQGINFDAYNSLELAGDVNSVREALGYKQIIYYGMSYGSQLGQHIMRDYPEILESVILDGANALSRKSWMEDRALDAQWGIDNLVMLCKEDEKCKQAYPDILSMLNASFRLFDNSPLPFAYTDPNDASLTINVDVTANDLADLLYYLQGDKNNVYSIPSLLATFSSPEHIEDLKAMLGGKKGAGIVGSRDLAKGGLAFLMHLAVVCSDDPVKSLDDIIMDGAGEYATLHARSAGELYVQGCPLIGVRELPDMTDQNVTVAIPTLVLSGDLDVATPVFRSQLIVDALPNATHVIFPGHTHVQFGQLNRCAADVYTQFIADPTATLDTSCLKETNVIGFLLPDGTSSQVP
jgi:pimeloyl-ACP methyl ester carboxylesterase